MTEFKIGDVVVLNSGGPLMTITEALPRANSVSCGWILPAVGMREHLISRDCLREPTASERHKAENPQLYGLPTRTTRCQDCGTSPARPACYGLRRFDPIGPGGGVEVIDWMNLCNPCAKARGFRVPD